MKKPDRQSSSPQRLWLWGGVFAMVAAIVAIVAIQDDPSGQAPDPATAPERSPASKPAQSDTSQGPVATRSSRSGVRGAANTDADGPPRFPMVNQIVSDESISDSQAVTQLREIVNNHSLKVDERYEALAHGLNLDLNAFVDSTNDAEFPIELATRFLEELPNEPLGSLGQIQGYLNLMNHSNQEIRSRASEQLAFVMEDEALAEAPDELRKVAIEKLERIRNSPPQPVQVAVDPAPPVPGGE